MRATATQHAFAPQLSTGNVWGFGVIRRGHGRAPQPCRTSCCRSCPRGTFHRTTASRSTGRLSSDTCQRVRRCSGPGLWCKNTGATMSAFQQPLTRGAPRVHNQQQPATHTRPLTLTYALAHAHSFHFLSRVPRTRKHTIAPCAALVYVESMQA
jgi:hypothetical protein